MITIVGLGPGNPVHLTREAWEVLEAAEEVHLRTQKHPTVAALPQGAAWHSFDSFYEQAGDFEELYSSIAAEVLALGRRPQGVVYAVPGHPLVGEATVSRILEAANQEGLPVRVVAGLSFVEPVLTALGIDALAGLQVVDAAELAAMHHPPLNPDLPALAAQLYSQALAADLKLTLMNQYPPEHPLTLVHSAGTDQERALSLPLYELDRQPDLAHLTTLYVPPLARASSFEAFQETIAHLRAPEGCPWDRKQTHQSLRSGLLEEVYEVLDALDREDVAALCEELGDLLLQIVMHAQIAVEAGEFSMSDVIATVDSKIKYRHPHVWGQQDAADAADVLRSWESSKAQERQDQQEGEKSMLAGVPALLPALAQALAYGERVARVGFDWPDVQGVLEKLSEEMAELRAAADDETRVAELGDVLFAVVNWARWLGVDPEAALRQTNARFARRFGWMEARANKLGQDLKQLSLDELESLWQQSKAD